MIVTAIRPLHTIGSWTGISIGGSTNGTTLVERPFSKFSASEDIGDALVRLCAVDAAGADNPSIVADGGPALGELALDNSASFSCMMFSSSSTRTWLSEMILSLSHVAH
jgi:hypothetical protein